MAGGPDSYVFGKEERNQLEEVIKGGYPFWLKLTSHLQLTQLKLKN